MYLKHSRILMKQFRTKIFQKSFIDPYSTVSRFESQLNKPKLFSDIPQPKGLLLIGTLLDRTLLRNFDPLHLHQHFVKRHTILEPIFKENLLGRRNMQKFTNASEDIKTIFCNNEKWPKRCKMDSVVNEGDSVNMDFKILNAKGGDWYKIKKLYNEYLLTKS